MARLVRAIHFPEAVQDRPASGKWMAATRAAMTDSFYKECKTNWVTGFCEP